MSNGDDHAQAESRDPENVRLTRLEAQQSFIREQLNRIDAGETRNFKAMLSLGVIFGTVFAGIFIVFGYINYRSNIKEVESAVSSGESRLNDALANLNARLSDALNNNSERSKILAQEVRERLDAIQGKTRMLSAQITNLRDETDVMPVTFNVYPQTLASGYVLFQEQFGFPMRVSVKGPGTGALAAVNIRSSGGLVEFVSTYPNSTIDRNALESLRLGVATYFNPPAIIVSDAPWQTVAYWQKYVSSCEQAQKDYDTLSKRTELGEISIQPVVTNLPGPASWQKFKLVMGVNQVPFSCKESFPLTTPSPGRH